MHKEPVLPGQLKANAALARVSMDGARAQRPEPQKRCKPVAAVRGGEALVVLCQVRLRGAYLALAHACEPAGKRTVSQALLVRSLRVRQQRAVLGVLGAAPPRRKRAMRTPQAVRSQRGALSTRTYEAHTPRIPRALALTCRHIGDQRRSCALTDAALGAPECPCIPRQTQEREPFVPHSEAFTRRGAP